MLVALVATLVTLVAMLVTLVAKLVTLVATLVALVVIPLSIVSKLTACATVIKFIFVLSADGYVFLAVLRPTAVTLVAISVAFVATLVTLVAMFVALVVILFDIVFRLSAELTVRCPTFVASAVGYVFLAVLRATAVTLVAMLVVLVARLVTLVAILVALVVISLAALPNPTSLALAAVNISDCKVEADLLSTLSNNIVSFKVEGLSLATLFNPNVVVVILELSNITSALLAFCIITAVPPSLISNLPAVFIPNVKLLESALPAIVLEVGIFPAKSVVKSVILDCAKVGILVTSNAPLVILEADRSGKIPSVTAAINSVKLNFLTAPESLLSRKIKLSFAMSMLDKAVKPLIISVVPMLVFVSVFIAEISRV